MPSYVLSEIKLLTTLVISETSEWSDDEDRDSISPLV